jgi:ATPase involved in DNA replication initiation
MVNIEPRLISRFEWGIVLPMTAPKPSLFLPILEKKAQAMNLQLPHSILEYIAETFTSSTISAVKALETLALKLHIEQKKGSHVQNLSPMGVQIMLAPLIDEERALVVTPEKIIEATAHRFSITQDELLGRTQRRECTAARQIAMYLCRTFLKEPFATIGKRFGRDHSTVMSAAKTVEEALKTSKTELTQPLMSLVRELRL